ncbi:hypothetical protein SNEBB_000048 [Seison nebaliae]|nr:hypothetical protein SNEBB_000048 [Seison nebaliae]
MRTNIKRGYDYEEFHFVTPVYKCCLILTSLIFILSASMLTCLLTIYALKPSILTSDTSTEFFLKYLNKVSSWRRNVTLTIGAFIIVFLIAMCIMNLLLILYHTKELYNYFIVLLSILFVLSIVFVIFTIVQKYGSITHLAQRHIYIPYNNILQNNTQTRISKDLSFVSRFENEHNCCGWVGERSCVERLQLCWKIANSYVTVIFSYLFSMGVIVFITVAATIGVSSIQPDKRNKSDMFAGALTRTAYPLNAQSNFSLSIEDYKTIARHPAQVYEDSEKLDLLTMP